VVFLNFTKIAPAAPNDPNVNEVTQLNNNWDLLETKLTPYISGGTITGIETGQEFFGAGFEYTVWNGSAGRQPDDCASSWSAWTTVPLIAPFTHRTGHTLKWRTNSLLRMVELVGSVQADAAASAWTPGSTVTITSDVAGAIPVQNTPIGGIHFGVCATALSAGTTVVAGARIVVDKPGANNFCRLRATYMGGPGGGNFIQADQIWWWY
jgi:hypothetical protein